MQPEPTYNEEIEKQVDSYLDSQYESDSFTPILSACKKFGNLIMCDYHNSPTAKYHW